MFLSKPLNIFTFFLFLASIGFVGSTAQAQTLTEAKIKKFVKETTAITKGQGGMSSDEVGEYLDKHLHEEGRFKSAMVFAMPGFPPRENSISLGKDEFIENVKKASSSLDGYDNDVEITEIKLSSDKNKATVFTIGTESGNMPVPTQTGETQLVPFEGKSECTQILMLDGDTIQMFNANCKTQIEFREF